jgi:hypothetical protein
MAVIVAAAMEMVVGCCGGGGPSAESLRTVVEKREGKVLVPENPERFVRVHTSSCAKGRHMPGEKAGGTGIIAHRGVDGLIMEQGVARLRARMRKGPLWRRNRS